MAAFSAAWCCAAGLPVLPGQWFERLLPALLCAAWGGCSVARGQLKKRTLLAVVLLALLVGWRALPPVEPPPDGHVTGLLKGRSRSIGAQAFEADVVSVKDSASGGSRLLLDAVETAASGRLAGRVVLYLRHGGEDSLAGRRIALSSTLRRISDFGNPGESSWRDWNGRRGVFVSAWSWSSEGLADLGPAYGFDAALARARAELAADIRRGRGPGAGLVAALVTGHRDGISPDDLAAIRDSGLGHLLAISGLHIGLVAGVVYALLHGLLLALPRLPVLYDVRRPALLAALAAAGAYGLMAGGRVPVLRAVIMLALPSLLLWAGRRTAAGYGLALACVSLLLWRGGMAAEAGFQLSFSAVCGLMLLGSARRLPEGQPRTWARRAVDYLAVCLVAWYCTAPLAAQHFGRLSLVAPLVNLPALPLVAVTVTSALALVLCWLFLPLLFSPLLGLAVFFAELLLGLARLGAGIPGAGLNVVAPGWPLLMLLLAGPPLLLFSKRRRLTAGILLVATTACLSLAWQQRWTQDSLEIVFASVGQGDSTLVRLPGGRVLLVDGGPPGRGNLVLSPLLRRMQIGRVDTMLATHVQSDHWGGFDDLVERVEAGRFVWPGGRCESSSFGRFLERLDRAGVPVVAMHGKGRFSVEGREGAGREGAGRLRLRILNPPDGSGECASNDRSLVLLLAWGGRRVLLTGDIESKAESRVLQGLQRGRRLDVVKVPHHGSSSSSTAGLVSRACPALAVASAGRDNHWGFPRPEVVERWQRGGCSFLSTSQQGAVRVLLERVPGRRRAAMTVYNGNGRVDYSGGRPDKGPRRAGHDGPRGRR
ncbi:MAG TPA: DNA internalization-related competence protein ComEC/Rec2 [candidate division UBP10 bacterium]|nr:DNA internalization-related competence protein ComEC/Rec2 [Candidatus Binatota bacterium]